MEKLKVWTAGKPHSKGSTGYSTSGDSMSSPHNQMNLTNFFISSYRGATVINIGQ